MHVTPLGDRILVRRLEEDEQKVGGIIIPDSAKEEPQHGQVIAIGKGRVTRRPTSFRLTRQGAQPPNGSD